MFVLRLTNLRIIVFRCDFILCDTQAKLKTPCMVKRCHGHAFIDEFWETVGDPGDHGDVVSLIVVSNPVMMLSCEVKKDVSYGSHSHFYQ